MDKLARQFVTIFKRLAILCWESSFYRFIFLASATLIAINIMGYHFGTFDQSIHIPYLKKFSDPSLYPNDRFFDMRFIHVSFFWFLFIPLYRIGLLEISMFIVYIFIIYLTFWAVWKLSKVLFNNPLVSFLSVIVFIMPHAGFGMLPLIEFSLLNRTFVLPFLLMAIILYLNKRYLTAYFLLGILYNFHVISVNFVMAMVMFDSIVRIRLMGWKKVIGGLFLFVIAALPVLIWKMQVAPVDISLNKEWFSLIDQGMLHHLFAILPLDPKLLILTINGIGACLLFLIGKQVPDTTVKGKIVNHFIIAVFIILGVEFITAQWLPVTIIIQSQIIRSGLFLLLFGYLYFVNFFVSTFFREGRKSYRDSFYLFLVMMMSGSPFGLAVVWWIYNRIKSLSLLKLLTVGTFILMIGLFAVLSYLQLWYPGINIYPRKGADYDVQMWAKNNTDKDDLFITPPHWFWFYDLEWRVISERSTVVTWSELAEAAFSPEYIPYWKPRFEDLAPGTIKRFKGDAIENKKIIARSFYGLSPEYLLNIGKKYGARYLVIEKPYKYPFTLLYENSRFAVYQLSP